MQKNIIILVLVLAIAGGVFWIIDYLGNSGVTTDIYTDDNATYKNIDNSINAFAQQKWSKAKYYQLKNHIERSQKKLLSDKQGQKLLGLLNAKYLKQLSEETERICTSSLELDLAKTVREELKKLKGKDIDKEVQTSLDNVDDFIAAIDIRRRVNNYKKKEYSKSQTNRFFRNLKNFETHRLLSKNNALLKRFSVLKNTLKKQKAFHKRDLSGGSCSMYKGYNYYYEKCDCIQNGNQDC